MRQRLVKLRAMSLWTLAATVAVVPSLAVFGLTNGANDSQAALTTISGVLEPCGGDYCLGDSVADFGQRSHLETTMSEVDFDGDGTIEALAEEVDGLVGQHVTLEVEPGRRAVHVDVVNGLGWPEHSGVPPEAPVPAGGDDGPQVTTTIRGAFLRCGEGYCIGDATLHFGPWWYLDSTRSGQDFDDDGTVETSAEELDGLISQYVTLDVKVGPRKTDVYAINGLPWREAIGGPPPWAGGPLRREPPGGQGTPGQAGPPGE